MQKVDKEGNVTKEYIDFVEKLNRDDLERFYMGVDFLKDELQQRINKAIEELENAYTDISNNNNANYIHKAFQSDLLVILKGVDKE